MCCENKATKRNYFSQSSALLYDQIISPRTVSSSIEIPESGYNNLAQHFNGKIQARDEYIKQSFVSKKQKFQTNFKIISCNLIEARFHRNDI